MLDWDDLRFFLAVARHGSLSAASKDLRVAQSTVGRRLTSLEAALGVRLLNRTPDGYMKTLAGAEVQAGVERLEAEILGIERSVSGRDTSLAGVVRVTCAETVANYILAPGLAALRKQHPDIVIDLIADQRDLSLAMREAEISIRLVQAEHHDLLARKIGRFTFALYACPAYLSEHGEPSYDTGCSGHQLIVQTGDLQDPERAAWLASLAPRARIGIQTSSHEAAVIAALHAAGSPAQKATYLPAWHGLERTAKLAFAGSLRRRSRRTRACG